MNLNNSTFLGATEDSRLADYSVRYGFVTAVFRDLKERLIEQIDAHDFVVGCVAWLTDPDILAALARKRSVSIVVQKEDFLRPDSGSGSAWKYSLRAKYDAIENACSNLSRYDMKLLSGFSYCGNPNITAIRCVGNHNSTKKPAFPRMHNKFAVFGHISKDSEDECVECLMPWTVWTGSFNFTLNGGESLENAVIIKAPEIAHAYFNEWQQIVALSEPLDWDSEWIAPEWRIGS